MLVEDVLVVKVAAGLTVENVFVLVGEEECKVAGIVKTK